MTKTKSTKRALLMSALALLMCVSMLIGSTFAWFTDSVTSAGNIIKSGTLDVTMEWADGTKAVPADDSADWKNAADGAIFKSELWEPGYTEVYHIKIANEGTLALKYQLNILANGEVSKLADVIDVYYADPATPVANRTDLTDDAKLGTLTEVLAKLNETASGNLKAGEKDTITLALKMQETAGNEYQNLAIGSDFAVQLLATQLTSEKDSFDELYDENATYAASVSTATELIAAVQAGGKIEILADIALDAPLTISAGTNVVLDMNGKSVSNATGNAIRNSGTLNVIGGEIKSETTYAVNNSGTLTIDGAELSGVFNSGDATLNDTTVNNTLSGKHAVYHSGSSLIVNGGTYSSTSGNELITASEADSPAVINSGTFTMAGKSYLLNNVVVNGGTFNGYVNGDGSNDEMRSNVTVYGGTFNFDPTDYVKAEGYTVVNNNNGTWTVKSNADIISEALANGETVTLDADTVVAEAITIPAGTTATLNLNGNSITAISGNAIVNKGALAITGGEIKSETTYAVNNAGTLTVTGATLSGAFNGGEATFNNTTINNVISGRHAIYNGGTKLTINGGVYTSTSGNELINNGAKSEIVINDGTFTMTGKSYLFGPVNGGIVINGGTFNGYVNSDGSNDAMRSGAAVVKGGTFNFDPAAWLADGYIATEADGVWTVTAK